MRTRYFYIILFLTGFIFSCKKKEFPESSQENNAVFYFKGEVNQAPYLIEAGNDDYYMYTSTALNSHSVYGFIGNLRKTNCTDCGASLLIQLNDHMVSGGGSSGSPDSVFAVKNYPFSIGSQTVIGVTFIPSYNKNAASYLWDFGDGTTSTDASPYHNYSKAGNYNVCLKITGSDGCVSQICNEQKVGQFDNVCKTMISSKVVSGNNVQFNQASTGVQPIISYVWDFGDGKTSTAANPAHTYAVTGSYPVSLRVTDANKNVAFSKYNMITGNDPSSCASNYSVQALGNYTSTPEPLNLNGVTISWTDNNGVVYKSSLLAQPASSYFEVLSTENFEINELGQKTKKLKVRFRATLYSGANVLVVDNAEAVIGVAYQ